MIERSRARTLWRHDRHHTAGSTPFTLERIHSAIPFALRSIRPGIAVRFQVLRPGCDSSIGLAASDRKTSVGLWLTLIAYSLGNLWRHLVLPRKIKIWSRP